MVTFHTCREFSFAFILYVLYFFFFFLLFYFVLGYSQLTMLW